MDKESKMFALVAEWESCGLTRKEFCTTHGIKLSNFSYWRGRYIKFHSSKESENFIKVEPVATTSFELIYPNGVKIVLPVNSDPETISSLIHLV